MWELADIGINLQNFLSIDQKVFVCQMLDDRPALNIIAALARLLVISVFRLSSFSPYRSFELIIRALRI